MQHLHGAADFIITANHRVQLALFGALGQINGVFVQRLTGFLGVRVIDGLTAAQIVDGIFQRFLGYALAQQQLAGTGVLIHGGQQHQLAGNELIALLLRQAIGLIQQARQLLRQADVAGRVADSGQTLQRLTQGGAQGGNIKADLHQQRLDRAVLLFNQRQQQVQRINLGVVAADRHGLGVGQGDLELAGHTVNAHE